MLLLNYIFVLLACFVICADIVFENLKGKSSSIGVGRGRAVAMRAKVSFLTCMSIFSYILLFPMFLQTTLFSISLEKLVLYVVNVSINIVNETKLCKLISINLV